MTPRNHRQLALLTADPYLQRVGLLSRVTDYGGGEGYEIWEI